MMNKKSIFSVISMCLIIMFLIGCSKLKKEFPTQPSSSEIQLHQTGWLDALSAAFHGNYIRENHWDLATCRKCHGNDYAGGTSSSSCNNQECHPKTPEACITCHGGTNNATGAPPKDIDDHIQVTFNGVGAHTAHVQKSKWGRVYDCDECHLKYQNFEAKGHVDSDLPAEIVWGEFSRIDNLSPNYEKSTCNNVYCHGASLSSGVLTNPVWTQTDSLACNACHGLPPGSGAHVKHIESLKIDCNTCHDGYLKNNTVNQQIHIDGNRDVQISSSVGGSYDNGVCSNVSCHGSGDSPAWTEQNALDCVGCHGGIDNDTGAPPVDLQGNTSRTIKGVGAHTAHVNGSRWGRAYDCNECHVKPTQINDPGHIDNNRPAEIVWDELAKTGNLTPSWDGSQCNNVYCHGASLENGSAKNPQWTHVDGISCDACHGLPPDTGGHKEHVENQVDCNTCHEGYSKNTSVNNAIHIDGKMDVQLSVSVGGSYNEGVCSNVACHGSGNTPNWGQEVVLTCTSCHGGTDNDTGAPPVDLRGNIFTTAKGVGAHTMHVSSSQWSNAFDCSECHVKPQNISDPGHIDLNQSAEIVWGDLSKRDGLSASWNGASCTSIYCHGASLQDGKITDAQWTQAEVVTCESCHGSPPHTGAHEEHLEYGFNCTICHNGYQENTTVNKEIHINGERDVELDASIGGSYANGICSNVICHGGGNTPAWTAEADFTCTSCHGGLFNDTGAPPLDLNGDSTKTVKGVGAHNIHLTGGTLSDGVECSECHIRPDETDDEYHIGVELLPAEITWGELAKHEGAIPSWDGVELCQNVYCHGEFETGNKDNNPSWIKVDGTQASCGTCHGLPPVLPHPQIEQCSRCHASVVDESNNIIDKTRHINGDVDLGTLK